MAKLSKNTVSLALIWLVVTALLTVAYACIPFPKNEASAIAFAFALFAVAAAFVVIGYAFGSRKTLVSRIYGYPIARVGIVYAIVQLLASLVLCVVGAFVNVPFWVALTLSLLLLACAGVGFIAADTTRDTIEAIDRANTDRTATMTSLRLTASSFADRVSDPEMKAALAKLADDLRFSDPVSSAATEGEELALSSHLAALGTMLPAGDKTAILGEIAAASAALADRNRKCLMNKR